MPADSSDEDASPIAVLRKRHRVEKKDLQAEIATLKRAVAKGDKKRKKQVAGDIAELESQLAERHLSEISALEASEDSAGHSTEGPSGGSEQAVIDDVDDNNEVIFKVSKAQRRREAKGLRDRQRETAVEAEMVADGRSGRRAREMGALTEQLSARRLRLVDIAADGHCLYNAVAHQLAIARPLQALEMEELRDMAASYIRENRDEIAPFLLSASGDALSDDQFDHYCDTVAGKRRHTRAAWGGQPEIRALSQSLAVPIEILQANSPPLTVGDEFAATNSTPLTITFHHHAYQLGEHYNSTAPVEPSDENENSDL